MDQHERRRLLYVAATRARDHLVVSLHRDAKKSASTAAQLLADAGATTPDTVAFALQQPAAEPVESGVGQVVAPPPPWRMWLEELTAIRDRAEQPAAISASGLEGTEPAVVLADDAADDGRAVGGKAKGARDVELPPWSKGRYGSAIGRAVHAVLQVVDLATGEGLDEAVAAQSLAEGVSGQEGLVRDLVRSALDSDVVQRAAAREHWRESYVGTVRDDGTVLEGYVDLVYREDDGSLMIVDYKTDAIPSGAVQSRVDYYRPQLEAYVQAHAAAVPGPVSASLLFLHPDGSTAVAL
jgi:ATP-dependent exoDNAse (exonuclease V) beta subunit